MILHYLKIALRSIFNEKIYSIVSILGLGIGITCSLLFLFWIRWEFSYDSYYENASRIYKVIEVENKDGELRKKSWVTTRYIETLKEQFPEIEAATFISTYKHAVSYKNGNSIITDKGVTNKDFFTVFDFKFIEGSPENSLNSPRDAVISSKIAKILFGNESAVGKEIEYFSGNLTITAVVEIPENTHIDFGVITPHGMHIDYGEAYIMVTKNATFDDDTRIKMAQVAEIIRKDNNFKLSFQPLADVHLYSSDIQSDQLGYGNIRYIYIFSVATFLVLLIAVINYINIGTARAANRGKEVGVRKVVGSSHKQLILRFLSESLIISAISVILSLCIIEILLPSFSSLMGTKIVFSYDLGTFAIIFGVCLLTALLSGGYAAFYMSFLNPVLALKGASQTGSKEGLRKTLLVLQFTLSILITICTIIVYKQLDYIINKDLGFDRSNILRLDTGVWYGVDALQKEFNNYAGIKNSTMSFGAPYDVTWRNNDFKSYPQDERGTDFHMLFTDYRFAETFGLEIVKGRYISEKAGWDYDTSTLSEESFEIVINETFWKYLGVEDPIGMKIKNWTVIGVVKDFHFRPFQEAISPLVIAHNIEEMNRLYIKVNPDNMQSTIQYIEYTYNKFKQDGLFQKNRPFSLTFLEDEYRAMYRKEFQLMKILTIFAILSLLISCMGIISMVSFMVERRSKEIAIRKITGAQVINIMNLFIREFTLLILISTTIASPIALWLMSNWLSSYVYRISISPLYFIAVIVFTLLIALLTLSFQVYRAAIKNPVESLRNE